MSSLQKLEKFVKIPNKVKTRRILWFERLMAIIALINLLLVFFDLSYIPLRDFWLHQKIQVFSFSIGPIKSKGFPLSIPIPDITPLYDPVKGIEDNLDTKKYLDKVEQLENQIQNIGFSSIEVEKKLKELRELSSEMIDTNPFQVANKTGNLEKIKNKMRKHIPNPNNSAKESFSQFWTQKYLASHSQEEGLGFFNTEIKPLIDTNYYRPIGENGEFIDLFGLIDFPFFILFGTEFLARTWLISRRHTGLKWQNAMLWRWYDIFFIIPLWRWLRIIPITIRLDQAKLIDLSAISKEIRSGFVASIAQEMTEVVVIQFINEVQDSISQGEITKWLSQQEVRPYIDLNDTDEVSELTSMMVKMTVDQVLPKIRPDLEALMKHYVDMGFQQSTLYQGLQNLPGLGEFQKQLTEELVKNIFEALYDGINALIQEDPVADELLQHLLKNLREALGAEIKTKDRLQEIQYLITAWLEEFKVNYVRRLSEEDLDKILDETRAIRQKFQ
ncbi:hypothetical protein BJP34_32465 [Moorena producens PAL-8-15-08-1]|uniref:Uncharacterized protein n=1 Tax=Moorena producens PAL-8-15-08-1 TaxID=1458985 RepID=A0A1D8U0W4_9CYAN|nr:hypothetical protein [Moorena producens]AOX03518.1 hypothetical protein BJP34_32465 [Moorena producens PAL-8-15-08-1]